MRRDAGRKTCGQAGCQSCPAGTGAESPGAGGGESVVAGLGQLTLSAQRNTGGPAGDRTLRWVHGAM